MFRDVPECSGMFHVPGFIDGRREKSKKALNQEYKVYGFSSIFASDTGIVSALLHRCLRMIDDCSQIVTHA